MVNNLVTSELSVWPDIYMVESRAGVDDGCQSNGNGLELVTEADCRNPTETRMEEGG